MAKRLDLAVVAIPTFGLLEHFHEHVSLRGYINTWYVRVMFIIEHLHDEFAQGADNVVPVVQRLLMALLTST